MNENWVFIDESNGAQTADGSSLSPDILRQIAAACDMQLNRDLSNEWGGRYSFRVAEPGEKTVKANERVFIFAASLPNTPNAIAYHDDAGNGIPYSIIAVTACDNLIGKGVSVSSAVSHEVLETAMNPGCNKFADDREGKLHAHEIGDAFEVQSYPVTASPGVEVYVSNFALPSFFDPNTSPPYNFMSKYGIAGAVDSDGPMQTAPGNGGNYQIVEPAPSASEESQVFAALGRMGKQIKGTPRFPEKIKHWSSRAYRIGVRLEGKTMAATKKPRHVEEEVDEIEGEGETADDEPNTYAPVRGTTGSIPWNEHQEAFEKARDQGAVSVDHTAASIAGNGGFTLKQLEKFLGRKVKGWVAHSPIQASTEALGDGDEGEGEEQ